MTVISTVISKHCTVHASDSMRTIKQGKRRYKPYEWKRSKIVPIRHWRGAMSFWGLALIGRISTTNWLQRQVTLSSNYKSAEEFANELAKKLSSEISRMLFSADTNSGIGIHFTAYEYIDHHWIPELFLISNWTDTSYTKVSDHGLSVTRETYHQISGEIPRLEHRNTNYRLQVHKCLAEGNMLIFNNGDPKMFNSAAKTLLCMFRELKKRKFLAQPNKVITYISIARRPIEIISKAQLDFCKEGTRIVGGKPHDLAITPGGLYESTTGDI